MLFENLQVNRIAVHEIFRRNDDKSIQAPLYSSNLEVLSSEAMGAFRLRMTDALSGQTQSLEMRVVKSGPGSFLDIAESLLGSNDSSFLDGSKKIANKLSEDQMARRIPGGMVIVFDGSVGALSVPFIGVIKAEVQQGFRRSTSGESAVIEFLNNIFLTPATRLYKIGLMIFEDVDKHKPDGRRAFIFDSNISASNREAAATYFYEGFLGCTFPSDGPYDTMRFFDLTKDFIRGTDLDPEKKRDIVDSLFVFVRDEQEPTFTSHQFGDRYLPTDLQDAYSNYMITKKFTQNAVVRDTSHMGNRLRRRRLKFGGDIELSASPEALRNKVEVKAIPAEDDSGNSWTRITIRERLTGEQ